MSLKKVKWLVLSLTLLVGGQGVFQLTASCPTSLRSDHRCCLARKGQSAQVKTAPPCRHCFEKASHAAIPQPVHNPVPVVAIMPKSDFPRTQDLVLREAAPYPRGNVFLPKPDIPILLRQILI